MLLGTFRWPFCGLKRVLIWKGSLQEPASCETETDSGPHRSHLELCRLSPPLIIAASQVSSGRAGGAEGEAEIGGPQGHQMEPMYRTMAVQCCACPPSCLYALPPSPPTRQPACQCQDLRWLESNTHGESVQEAIQRDRPSEKQEELDNTFYYCQLEHSKRPVERKPTETHAYVGFTD